MKGPAVRGNQRYTVSIPPEMETALLERSASLSVTPTEYMRIALAEKIERDRLVNEAVLGAARFRRSA